MCCWMTPSLSSVTSRTDWGCIRNRVRVLQSCDTALSSPKLAVKFATAFESPSDSTSTAVLPRTVRDTEYLTTRNDVQMIRKPEDGKSRTKHMGDRCLGWAHISQSNFMEVRRLGYFTKHLCTNPTGKRSTRVSCRFINCWIFSRAKS